MNGLNRLGIVALLACVIPAVPHVARACSDAQEQEATSLRRTMASSHAAHRWADVDAKYRALVNTTCALSIPDHGLAANAALQLGDIRSAFERYERMNGASQLYPELRPRFGRVTIEGPKPTTLARTGGPPPGDAGANALRFAREQLDAKGGFDGWLPLGTYEVGTARFEVKADGQIKAVYNAKIGWSLR